MTVPQLDYAWDEFSTITRLVRDVENAFEQGDHSPLVPAPAQAYCEDAGKRLLAIRNRFIERNVQLLVDAVSADCKSGPVLMPQIH